MTIKLEFVSTLPDPLAFETLMREYYQVMVDKLINAGGPTYSAAALRWDNDPCVHWDRFGDGALGKFENLGAGLCADRLFHANGAADDRGSKYLALFLHAAVWSAGAVNQLGRPAISQLAW